MTTSGVYIITRKGKKGNPAKVYIGSSTRVERRLADHRQALSRGEHYNPHLQSAWNHHGAKAFSFTLLEECSRRSLAKREQFHIDHFDSMNPQHGYNQRGPERRGEFTDEVLAKIRKPRSAEGQANIQAAVRDPENRARFLVNHKAAIQNPEWRAKLLAAVQTPEHRARQSASRKETLADPEAMAKHLANCRTPEFREAQRIAHLGQRLTSAQKEKHLTAVRSPGHRAKMSTAHLGKKHTAETKAKMSAAHLGKEPTPEWRKKHQAGVDRYQARRRRETEAKAR